MCLKYDLNIVHGYLSYVGVIHDVTVTVILFSNS